MSEAEVRARVLAALRARRGAGRFVREVHAELGLAEGAEVEPALAALEAEGAVVVRDHPCADPHLAGVDLRIVALVEPGVDGDARIRALEGIERTWQRWLAEYLASHRCG
jgi:hypothetical protein